MGPHNNLFQRPAFAVLIFLLGFMLFSWPLLTLGDPHLTLYMFGSWILIILCLPFIGGSRKQ